MSKYEIQEVIHESDCGIAVGLQYGANLAINKVQMLRGENKHPIFMIQR